MDLRNLLDNAERIGKLEEQVRILGALDATGKTVFTKAEIFEMISPSEKED